MVTANDIAAYILERRPSQLSQMHLHKLLYFVQAGHLSWFDSAAFPDEIQAWQHGPVVPKVYYKDYGSQPIDVPNRGNSAVLDDEIRYTVDRVLGLLGDETAGALRNLSHRTKPWLRARGDVPDHAPSSTPIAREAIRGFHRHAGVIPPSDLSKEEREAAERLASGDHSAISDLLATLN